MAKRLALYMQDKHPIPYELSDEEYQLLRAITHDPTLNVKQKEQSVFLAIRCPQLMAANPEMESRLFEYLRMQVDDDLQAKNTVLVAEFMRAQAVLRQPDHSNGEGEEDEDQDLYFFERLKAFCEEWSQEHGVPVHFHVVHGGTPEADRRRSLECAAESDRTGESKTVILANSKCLELGKDLRFVRRMISLEWPWNSPRVQQLLKRALRAGNTDIMMTVFYALGTLEEGTFQTAQDKYKDICDCIYGGKDLSDEQLWNLSRDTGVVDTRDMRILSQLFAPEQRISSTQRWLQGRGMQRYSDFMERHPDEFRQRIAEASTSGIGDRQRFVGSLVAKLERKDVIQGQNILHHQSKGLTLERELRRIVPDTPRAIVSVDPHENILEQGRSMYRREGGTGDPRVLRGGIADLGNLLKNRTLRRRQFDAVVLEDLEFTTAPVPQDGSVMIHQRARSLANATRVLRKNGTLVVVLPREACTKEEFEQFCEKGLPPFGLKVREEWSSEGRSTDNEGDVASRFFAAVATKTREYNQGRILKRLDTRALKFTHSSQWRGTRERAWVENAPKRRRLPYPLIHTQFTLCGKKLDCGYQPEVRARQVQHLENLTHSVELIRDMAPTADDLRELSKEDIKALRDCGIEFLPQLSITTRRPAFRLSAYQGDLLHPYDKQWNE